MIYCGVDGGGSKTKVAIYRDDVLIGEMLTSRSSIDTIPLDESIRTIQKAITEIYIKEKITERIDSIYLSLGGIANKHQVRNVNQAASLIKELHPNATINSGNDITGAFRACCNGRNNITVIIGTGSVAFGVDEDGNCHRAGGVHYLEGDLGSSYDIGSKLMSIVSQVLDGRTIGSALTKFYLTKLNLINITDLINFYVKHKQERTYIASFAKDVIKYALLDDIIAMEILDTASNEIIKHVIAVDKNINLKNREVGLVGSLGNSDPYRSMIIKKIHKYDPRLKVHGCDLEPVEGAIIEAKMQCSKKSL